MDIQTPTTEQVTAICSERSARFPEPAAITMPGDRGVPVRLPFILGNPSGSCLLPDKERSSTWASFISAMFKLSQSPDNIEDVAAMDCILYPDFATYAEWCKRWPALPGAVWRAVRKKCGIDFGILDEPAFDDVPAEVKEASNAFPSASLRSFSVRRNKTDYKIIAIIDAPSATTWRFFLEAMRKPKADHWTLTRQMAQASIKLVFDQVSGKAMNLDEEVIAPWPGIAVLSVLTVGQLAGVSAEIELGEF